MTAPGSNSDIPRELHGYPTVIRLPVQWGDQDAFGHVNNTVAIRWFESSRVAYWHREDLEGLMKQFGISPILASIKCDYRKQLHFPDTVLVGARIAKLGNAGMTMDHVVYSLDHSAVAAEGVSVVVAFDYQKNRPVRIAEEIRAAVARLENWDRQEGSGQE
jgi:acyl-CoA thioester hydrolase